MRHHADVCKCVKEEDERLYTLSSPLRSPLISTLSIPEICIATIVFTVLTVIIIVVTIIVVIATYFAI